MQQIKWIWQQKDWPNFSWDGDFIASKLRDATQLQGRLLGKVENLGPVQSLESSLDAQLQNIVQSSAIEGENLNVESVRSSLAIRLGVKEAGLSKTTAQTDGLAELLLDATQNYEESLTLVRLYQWHEYLFPKSEDDSFLLEKIKVGTLRGNEAMQVVSGPHNKRTVHFEAPPRDGLHNQLENFMAWLDESREDSTLDPLLRAGLAHFWFVTLHPFDDGNGRLARVVSDYVLAQGERQSIRYYAMAASIMENRKSYYEILESTQKGSLDITGWMSWFLDTLKDTFESALSKIDLVLQKAMFWQLHSQDGLKPEQVKVLNRLLDAGPEGFEGGLSAKKYQSLAKVSKATATRHITDMLDKNCIVKLEGGGRNTKYEINWVYSLRD
jgi:Fic family protein